jgi:dTDP-4-dehydrorhamnose reductase
MKIILFGSTGMLGNYVKHFSLDKFKTVCIDRNTFDIETGDWSKLYHIIDSIKEYNDIIINCAGAIPQREVSNKKYIILNTVFPIKLNQYAKLNNLKFIHITTDCVFSGKDGNYNENSIHDSDSIYGITKSLGEEPDMCILRTSIIGEEKNNKNSLIEWVKTNKNGIINGYENFIWNGITCLQLTKIIFEIIKNNIYWKGTRHFFSPSTVSKFKLCSYINYIYNLNITINKTVLPFKNMSLTTINNENLLFNIPDIQSQLIEQYTFTKSYFSA